MNPLHQLLSLFFRDWNQESAEENESFFRYDLVIKGNSLTALDRNGLKEAFSALGDIAESWSIRISLKGQDAPHSFTKALRTIWDIGIEELQNDISDTEISKVNVTLERQDKAVVNVISPDRLLDWIKTLRGDAIFDVLRQACPFGRPIILVNDDFVPCFGSSLIFFTDAKSEAKDWLKDREKVLAQRRELIVSDWGDLPYLAQDFRWHGPEEHSLRPWFGRLENFMAVISLADGSQRKNPRQENGILEFVVRVRGHRLREQDLKWNDLPATPDLTLRQIDDWCYHTGGAGPLSDKLGLTRNFVSLHWETQKLGIFGMSLRVVRAVRDGYQLYLKRNLKEYVDLRSKVIGSILELDGKAAKAVETVAGNLERNFYGIVTVVVATVFAKVVGGNSLTVSMTPGLKALGLSLCGVSVLHAVYARDAALLEMTRAKEVYADLKSQYSEFFEPSLIDSIFGDGSESSIAKMEVYVKKRVRKLMWIWASTVVLFAFAILFFERLVVVLECLSKTIGI